MMRKTLWLVAVAALVIPVSAIAVSAQQDSGPVVAPMPKKVNVSAAVVAGNRIGGNMPEYPAIAKAAKIQGTVVLQATIGKEGTIENLRVISGPPMLQAAATDAVRTWTYKPYLLNGQPVEVETQVNVVFSLPEAAEPAAAGGAGAMAAGAVPPEHPITVDQVHEMMRLTGSSDIAKQMLDGMMPVLKQNMPPYMPDDVLDDFEKTLVYGGVFDRMVVQAYQAHFSTEDAAVTIEFYKTPAGQRILAAMPLILKDTQAAGEQAGEQTMMEVLERHKAEIDAAKLKYEQEKPWTAPKN